MAIPTLALHLAAFHGDAEAISSMPNPRTALDALDPATGETALLIAIEQLHTDCVSRLLALGANPNARGRAGVTPLHLAIDISVEDSKGHMDQGEPDDQPDSSVVRLLLAAGADPTLKDPNGHTALDWALELRHEPAERLMANYSQSKERE